MRRRLFTLAFALSLLLCVATVVLWVRSYSIRYGLYLDWPTLFSRAPASSVASATSCNGAVHFAFDTTHDDDPRNRIEWTFDVRGNDSRTLEAYRWGGILGFRVSAYRHYYGPAFGDDAWYRDHWALSVPHWAITASL